MISNPEAKIPVVVIFAPTATGKTALCLNIFGKGSHSFFKAKGELISADSMQVYRGLDIGTAKPDNFEKEQLTHHLIDVLDFNEQFNVSDFIQKADELCESIFSQKKIPVVAGGTGFYIRNFLLGLPETPESNEDLRQALIQRCKIEGKEKLYQELEKIDPESAEKINPNDEYRILRALEVFYLTGKPRSCFKLNTQLREKYNFCIIILEREREELYERINRRVDLMFEAGLKKEVTDLISKGATEQMPGMQAIGYREWFLHDYNTQEGIEKIKYEIKRNSRKYAKKQYTFMKDIPGAHIVDASDEEKTLMQVTEIIKNTFSTLDLKSDLGNNK